MKKFLFLGALAAMLLGTASCSNDMEPAMTDDGMVQFTIELPGNIDSRAIADGMTANKLTVAVYDENGNELPDIRVNKDIPHQTTVEFKLVKGQTYSFAFWAQAEGAPYTFDTAGKSVSVDYTNAKCNDETRDAFYAYKTLTVDGPINQTVYLTRPFAQLNYGADDLAAAKAAGIVPLQTKLVVSKVANTFNLATGEATGEEENVEFALAGLPDATTDNDGNITPATLTVENKPYAWMEMSYFLVPANEANVDVEMTATTTQQNVNVPVANVPVKKNHRTNIVGSLFTEDVIFNVIIDQNFDVADYNIDYNAPVVPAGKANVNGTEYNTIADALAAADGKTIYLGEGTYNETINVPANGNVSIHAGNGLYADDVIINKQVKAEEGSTLDLKNVTVKTNNTVTNPAIDIVGATATLDGIKADGSRGVAIENGSNVTIKNSDIAATGSQGYPRGVQLVGENNNVTVEGSNISAVHYAFNFIGGANSNTINLKNSTVTGWGVVNIWSSNNNIEFDNCTLNSINDKPYNADGWNNFSAFVYNNDGSNIARDNVVTILNSKVNVSSTKEVNKQSLIGYAGYNNKTIFKNVNVVGTDTNTDEPLTFRSYGCDFFDADHNFIGTNEMLATLCNCTDNVTCTWNGNPLDLVEYFTFE